MNTYKFLYNLGNVEIHGLQAHEEIVVLRDTLEYLETLLYGCLSKLTVETQGCISLLKSIITDLPWLKSKVSPYLLSTEHTQKNL